MGPIQSSLNHLVGTAWGTVASAAVAAKKFLPGKEKAQKPQAEKPKAETTGSMGNIVKIGRVSRNQYAKSTAYLSANNAVDEKAASRAFSVQERLAEATSLSVSPKKDEGGKK